MIANTPSISTMERPHNGTSACLLLARVPFLYTSLKQGCASAPLFSRLSLVHRAASACNFSPRVPNVVHVVEKLRRICSPLRKNEKIFSIIKRTPKIAKNTYFPDILNRFFFCNFKEFFGDKSQPVHDDGEGWLFII